MTRRAGAVALLLAAVLVTAPGLRGGTPRPEIHDLLEYFYPVYEAFYRSVRDGTPLLWNPYQLCGVPWTGTLLPGFFYPPHVLYLLLPVDRAVALSGLAHLGLIAVSTAAFARRVGSSAPAAALAALVFTLSGTVRDWQRWPYHLEAGAWLPLGALGVLAIAGGGGRRGAAVVATALGASWLAGSPQVTFLLLYAWTALLAALLLRRPGAWPTRQIASYGAALIAGTLVGAVALLPAVEVVRLAVRRTSSLSLAAMYPWGIPTPASLLAVVAASRPRPLALAALALAPFALADRRRRRVALWALGVAVAFTALALSPLTPLFDLYRLLPGLGWFRGPNRLLFVTHLGVALLAALGLDMIVRRRAVAVVALVALALLDLLLVPGAPPAVPNAGVARAWPPELEAAYRRLATTIGSDRVWTFGDRSPAALPPKLPTVAGLRALGDYEPGALRRQAEYLTFFAQGAPELDSPVPFEGRLFSLVPPPGRAAPASRRRLLDLAAVRFVVMPAATLAQPEAEAFVRDAGLEPSGVLVPGVRLLTNPHALPRAYVTYRTAAAPPPAALLARLADAGFDPLLASYVEGETEATPGAPPRGAAAIVVRDEPRLVEVVADLTAPGLVVLADTFHPDWVATVDGVAAPIVAVNHLFRGVRAPAGRHRVRFVHRPTGLWIGAALSALGLLALLGAVVPSRPMRTRTVAICLAAVAVVVSLAPGSWAADPEGASCDTYVAEAARFARGRAAGVSLADLNKDVEEGCRLRPRTCAGMRLLAADVTKHSWTPAGAAAEVRGNCGRYMKAGTTAR